MEEAARLQHEEHQEAHRKMSTSGQSLYELLGLEKGADAEEVKRAYRRLALRYHPDKNRDNPDTGEKFKEISYANSILSDETKKRIYDAYGSMGIHLSEQIGEDNFEKYMMLGGKWFKDMPEELRTPEGAVEEGRPIVAQPTANYNATDADPAKAAAAPIPAPHTRLEASGMAGSGEGATAERLEGGLPREGRESVVLSESQYSVSDTSHASSPERPPKVETDV